MDELRDILRRRNELHFLADDIALVELQAHCSRDRAVALLIKYRGDVVNAIMNSNSEEEKNTN